MVRTRGCGDLGTESSPRRAPSGATVLCPVGGWGFGTGPARGSRPTSIDLTSLAVEVEGELRRVRPQPHRVDLVRPLVVDPGPDQLLAEDAATEQELVVGLERVERLVERARHLRDVRARPFEQVVV